MPDKFDRLAEKCRRKYRIKRLKTKIIHTIRDKILRLAIGDWVVFANIHGATVTLEAREHGKLRMYNCDHVTVSGDAGCVIYPIKQPDAVIYRLEYSKDIYVISKPAEPFSVWLSDGGHEVRLPIRAVVCMWEYGLSYINLHVEISILDALDRLQVGQIPSLVPSICQVVYNMTWNDWGPSKVLSSEDISFIIDKYGEQHGYR